MRLLLGLLLVAFAGACTSKPKSGCRYDCECTRGLSCVGGDCKLTGYLPTGICGDHSYDCQCATPSVCSNGCCELEDANVDPSYCQYLDARVPVVDAGTPD